LKGLPPIAEAIATPRIASDGKKDIALKIDKWARVMYLVMCAFTVIFSQAVAEIPFHLV